MHHDQCTCCQKTRPLALYVHWPYCISKCNYCAFNSIASCSPDAQSWYKAIVKELSFEAQRLSRSKLHSIYFGGGTPSLIPPVYVKNIIDLAIKCWPAANIEVTLEVNPATVNHKKLSEYILAGVNRLSLGIQSFNDGVLSFLGRKHSAKQAEEAFWMAKDAGFHNISIDLIFAVPGQTQSMLEYDINNAINMGPQHISAYQLTLEEGTKLHNDYLSGLFIMPDDDAVALQYDKIRKSLRGAGYKHYEISNFAKPKYKSKHNLAYWQYREYLGLGPGAHSRIMQNGSIFAIERASDIRHWLNNPLKAYSQVKLSKKIVLTEALLMGLRTSDGVDIDDLTGKIGAAETNKFLDCNEVKKAIELGMLKKVNRSISIPSRHYLKTDAIIKSLLR